MIHRGCGLRMHGGHGLWVGIVPGAGVAFQNALPGVIVIKPRLGENKHVHIMHKISRGEKLFALHHVFPCRQSITILPRPGAHQNHTGDLFGMTEGQLLGNHAAKGTPHHTGFFNSQHIHQGRVVVGHHLRRVRPSRLVGVTHSAIVPQNAAKTLLPLRRMSLPDRSRGCDAHDEDEGIAAAAFGVGHFDSGTELNFGHGVSWFEFRLRGPPLANGGTLAK